MNIIEIIGYCTIYLFLGWTTLPIYEAMIINYGKEKMGDEMLFFVILWPFSILSMLMILWLEGWNN